MTKRRLHPGVWLVLLTLGLSFVFVATAAPPARINNLVSRLSFSPQDLNRIKDFADFWCRQLEHADPGEVKAIRQSMLDPLKAPGGVSEVFRLAYSDAVLGQLKPLVQSDNPLLAYNAIHIIGSLGTPDALRILLDHCDVTNEPRFGVRLWVAKCLNVSVNKGALRQNDVNRALRRLGRAAGRETHWLVLRRQFEVIASVQGEVSREVFFDVLSSVADQMAADDKGPSSLMKAVRPAVKLIRDRFLLLAPADQNDIGRELAPILGDICSAAEIHWDMAQVSSLKKSYGGAVADSEHLLTFINNQLPNAPPGPQTRLGEAWKQKDKPRFETDHDKWMGILSRPPYKR